MPKALDIQNFANEQIQQIQKLIRGRIAHEQHNCNYLAWAIKEAGDGDHLEIGTLFGGSAILAALVKESFGFRGDIYCVDPLDGYYKRNPEFAYPVDPVSGIAINEETVYANARAFGVEDRIHVIAEPSRPWPKALERSCFASAFIDGDHWGELPLHDWHMVSPRTSKMVVFDNYDEKHPAVMEACKVAAHSSGWRAEFVGGITYILRRVYD